MERECDTRQAQERGRASLRGAAAAPWLTCADGRVARWPRAGHAGPAAPLPGGTPRGHVPSPSNQRGVRLKDTGDAELSGGRSLPAPPHLVSHCTPASGQNSPPPASRPPSESSESLREHRAKCATETITPPTGTQNQPDFQPKSDRTPRPSAHASSLVDWLVPPLTNLTQTGTF